MHTLRKSHDRGHANHGWLDSYHTFSFADYYDPAHMQFRTLRVINEDRIAAGQGFGTHPHRDMEILTYMIKGRLMHRDSMGNEGVITAGEVQKMSAGTGVTHSEFNGSPAEEAHLLQIWILPDSKGHSPSYQQQRLPQQEGLTALPVTFHQDIKVFRGLLAERGAARYALGQGRAGWVQMIRGTVTVNGVELRAGDGLAVEEESSVACSAKSAAEFLFFDLK